MQKGFNTDKKAFKLYHKVRDHCHYTGKYWGAVHNIFNLICKIPKEISAVFHNGTTYNYNYIINELAKELESQFEFLGENTEKYITFSVLIKKEIENGKTITYKWVFIEPHCWGSLSSLVDNLSEGSHTKKCGKFKSCLEYISIEDNKLIWKCVDCNKNYELHFDKDLINRFANAYEFFNKDINKFILLLRKTIYPYEYMDSWKSFDETLLPDK